MKRGTFTVKTPFRLVCGLHTHSPGAPSSASELAYSEDLNLQASRPPPLPLQGQQALHFL